MTTVAGKAAEIQASACRDLLFNKDEWASQSSNQPLSVSGTDGCQHGKEN
jgi:hypothetical protein